MTGNLVVKITYTSYPFATMLLITVEIIWTDNFFITVVLGQTDGHTHTHFATMLLITVETKCM